MKQLIAISLCLVLALTCSAKVSEQVAVTEQKSFEKHYQLEPAISGTHEVYAFKALNEPTMYLEFVKVAPFAHYSGYKAQGKFGVDTFGQPHRFT